MQVLKDDVRQNILEAALNAFKEHGYKKASMRDIASEAGLSVGNLYRYYKNKESIFDTLVEPLVEQLVKERDREKVYDLSLLDVNLLEYDTVITRLVGARLQYRDEMFILFLRSEGSKYENAREEMTKVFEEQLGVFLSELMQEKKLCRGELLPKMITTSMVEVFFTVLETAKTDREFILNLLEFLELAIKPMIRTMIAFRDNDLQSRRISDEEIMDIFNRHSTAGGCGGAQNHGHVE